MKYISLIILLAYFKKIGQTFVFQNRVFQKLTKFVLGARISAYFMVADLGVVFIWRAQISNGNSLTRKKSISVRRGKYMDAVTEHSRRSSAHHEIG